MNTGYVCSHCGSTFSRQWNLDRHVKSTHTTEAIFTCSLCGKTCTRSGNLEKHLRTFTGAPVAAVASTSRSGACPAHRFTAQRGRRSLGRAVETHTVDMGEARQLAALEDAVLAFEPAMAEYRQRHHGCKYQVVLDVLFHKAVDHTVVTQPPVTLRTTMAAVYAGEQPNLVETSRHLLDLVEVYEHNGSGWVFSSFVSMELRMWHLDPLRASAFVPLPKWIRDKHAVINVEGTGYDCFKWAVLAALHPATSNPSRMVNYTPFENRYDFDTLTFPVSLQAITPFAKRNGISINVYAIEGAKRVIFPLCVTESPIDGKHIDLLMHGLGGIQHYSAIRNFSRLVSRQTVTINMPSTAVGNVCMVALALQS